MKNQSENTTTSQTDKVKELEGKDLKNVTGGGTINCIRNFNDMGMAGEAVNNKSGDLIMIDDGAMAPHNQPIP